MEEQMVIWQRSNHDGMVAFLLFIFILCDII